MPYTVSFTLSCDHSPRSATTRFDFWRYMRYFRKRNLVCMKIRLTHFALAAVAVVFFSCNSMPSKNHGPIVLGDSSTIVTETDPDKLHDLVTDLQPVIKPAVN